MRAVVDRRSIVAGLFAVAISGPAWPRGMYCTRHPDACRRRREADAEANRLERQRRAMLSPEDRAAEDAQRQAAWQAEKDLYEKQAADRAAAEAEQSKALTRAMLLIATASGIAGLLLALAVQRRPK